ncbi:transposase [Micromonospora sp. U56]|uniref:IS110 family transposase n=1 Tax=Micromonospora sp. U56 TaxID=2824900 RepID=UPI0027DC9519|nr:transposase [Micromonospora sp. U56]
MIDSTGGLLGGAEFPSTTAGYADLLAWIRSIGRVSAVGVEGTGSYGAGLARYLTSKKVTVVEVDRPDRRARRAKGKSDPIDCHRRRPRDPRRHRHGHPENPHRTGRGHPRP